jgi:hypothetical protein
MNYPAVLHTSGVPISAMQMFEVSKTALRAKKNVRRKPLLLIASTVIGSYALFLTSRSIAPPLSSTVMSKS